MGESGRDDDENLLLGVVHLGHTHENYFWWGKRQIFNYFVYFKWKTEQLSFPR